MKKIFLFVVSALFSLNMVAKEGGSLTCSPAAPIDPTATITISYDGTNTNFNNWDPQCFIHAWLVPVGNQTFSQAYGTDWVSCDGDADYTALDEKVKMTYVSRGIYTISINIQSFFGVADEDLEKIEKLGIIVRAQYPGDNNQTDDFFLNVAIPGTPEPDSAKFYITGDSALMTDAGYPAKIWNSAGIKSTEDSMTLSLKGGVEYQLKVTVDGTWDTAKGFSDLTGDKPSGVKSNLANNIIFTLTEDGDVVVKYTADSFSITGSFVVSVDSLALTNGYYLLGSLNTWAGAEEFLFVENPDTPGEYKLENVTLAIGDEIKVGRIENDVIVEWFGDFNYVIDADHAGIKDIYFRPSGNKPDWDEFGGYVWMGSNSNPITSLQSVTAEQTAYKTIENGQLYILKNGVKYNTLGAEIK
ncbi:MAG: hypothetical protein K6A36_06345 [Paludibacteraceae bacterium]|nr:hypothetical protein [Paludibacteraceae bacterium]